MKKKCCRKFIKKDKHCSKCPAALDDQLKQQLIEAEKKKKSKGKKKKNKKK